MLALDVKVRPQDTAVDTGQRAKRIAFRLDCKISRTQGRQEQINKIKKYKMEIKEIKITNLKPYKDNAKKHPQKQIDLLKANIEKFGFTTPVLIDKDNTIIAGHGRLLAMKSLGKETVPCVQMGTLTEEEVKALRLADNRIAEMGEWDMELVIAGLKDISAPLLDLTGFSKDLIITPEEADDEAPALPDEPQSKLGDLYELGVHRVLCGDSTNLEDVERLMSNMKADMVFTDPPYGVNYVSRVDKEKRKDWGEIKNDNLKGDKLQEFLKDSLSLHTNAKSRYICCNWQSVRDFFDACGMPNSLIVWDKKSLGLGANYRSQHEFILFYGKLSHRNETNVWSMKRDSTSEYVHPTQKPVELIVRAITNSSSESQLVFDAFLGSGSTLIAAQKTKRTCYGMELDPKYVDVIVSRYCKYANVTKIKKNGETIDWVST